ncbi:sigma-70 family RNA polymerase sigma factor [Rhodopseudomonas sp. P2A-2r]|uniref:RNA polymerase sigma factor n=1 Tax=Rhodopseudomonas sp. P2A-2r TaxID=2991972 RepID=UPI0022342AE5|nr:sigma-70 family RNA polymerase sigma factor [Rhodopseudomonas sp. P2A-2r]UZE50518.1 sigma-70 family RNA polymerase sigma factor [Rhodopseudomonas sp. P2A-2r]
MADSAPTLLRQLLITGYDELKRRLTRRVGSADVAAEALHETWIRLGHLNDTTAVRRPESYLYRMALNVAVDRHRADRRWFDKASFESVLRADDDQLDPEQIVSMQSEMTALERVLAELPERRRAIFLAALTEELTYRDIAKRFGISLRSVEREMSRAFGHCGKRIESFAGKRRVAHVGNVLSIEKARQRTGGDDRDD